MSYSLKTHNNCLTFQSIACPNGSVGELNGPYWGNKWNQDKYATDSMTCKEYLELCKKKRQQKENNNGQTEDEKEEQNSKDEDQPTNEDIIGGGFRSVTDDSSVSSTDLVYKKEDKSYSEYIGKFLVTFTKTTTYVKKPT